MKANKTTFTSAEATAIRQILAQVRASNRDQQKKLRAQLRKVYGFYISAFSSSKKGFTNAEFDELVKEGRISVRKS